MIRFGGAQVDDAYASHVNALLARGPESRKQLAEVAVLLEDCGLLGALDIGPCGAREEEFRAPFGGESPEAGL